MTGLQCLGGDNVSLQCGDAYHGPLCQVCAEGHYRTAAHECLECAGISSSATYGGLGILTAVVLALIVLGIRCGGGSKSNKKAGKAFDALSSAASKLGNVARDTGNVKGSLKQVGQLLAEDTLAARMPRTARCLARLQGWQVKLKAVSYTHLTLPTKA